MNTRINHNLLGSDEIDVDEEYLVATQNSYQEWNLTSVKDQHKANEIAERLVKEGNDNVKIYKRVAEAKVVRSVKIEWNT